MRVLFFASLFSGVLGTPDTSAAHFWCHKTKDGLCESSDPDDFSPEGLHSFVRKVTSAPRPSVSETVDPSTIRNKVLAGYQGWAGARSTWDHWSNDGKAPNPSLGNEHFEMVPQIGEYPASTLHDTDFKYNGNGSVVKLYENAKDGVVDLHFKWMKDYGMDGVLIQRFISDDARSEKALQQRNTILAQMDVAAAKHGRVYAMMWDISGPSSEWDTQVKDDYITYVKKYTASQQYLKEKGRPVVCIFGIGLTGNGKGASASSALSLIRWLQSEGLYVIGSGPYYWRTGGQHDALSGFDEVHAAFDAIMPWAVGRYNTVRDFESRLKGVIKDDAQLTSSRNQDYAPIAYAGYSYRGSNEINFIKRNAGQFFQAQIDAFLDLPGATFYYIAMFDEVQEGTAIYKFAANEAESAAGRDFVTASIDGVDLPGDFYLTMAGQYTTAAHGGPRPPTPPPPGLDTILRGNSLESGDQLVSASNMARLAMQASDGNLVLYGSSGAVWSSQTPGHPGAHLNFQESDGNLVLYDGSTALWSSGAQSGAAKVVLQDDCDLVIVGDAGKELWSLGTSCSLSTIV